MVGHILRFGFGIAKALTAAGVRAGIAGARLGAETAIGIATSIPKGVNIAGGITYDASRVARFLGRKTIEKDPGGKNIFNLFTGVRAKPRLQYAAAAAILATGFGYGVYQGARGVVPSSFVGGLPSTSYDYAANVDRLMLASRGMPGPGSLNATGDLVLALSNTRGNTL